MSLFSFFFSLSSSDSKYKYIESNIFTPGDENEKGWKNKCFMYQSRYRREDFDEITEKQTMGNIAILRKKKYVNICKLHQQSDINTYEGLLLEFPHQ